MHESVHILHDTPTNLQVSYAIRSFMNELRNIFGPLEFVEMDGGDTVLYQIKQLPGMRSKEKDYDLSFFFYPSRPTFRTALSPFRHPALDAGSMGAFRLRRPIRFQTAFN